MNGGSAVGDRLDAADRDTQPDEGDGPAIEGPGLGSPFRRRARWAAGVVVAAALIAALLPVLGGDGVSDRTAIGRVVVAAAAGGSARTDKVLTPAVTATPTEDASDSPSSNAATATQEASPRAGRTLFGTSLDFTVGGGFANWVDHADGRFGTLPVVRAFNPAFPRSWSAADAVAGRTTIVSFKADPEVVTAGDLDERLRQWFANAPDTGEIYWTYYHEPEDNVERGEFTAEQFRAAWKHINGLADEVDKDNQFATLILMGWTLNPSAGRDFKDYYPGDEHVDVLGWDCYNLGHSEGRYADPEAIYGRAIDLSEKIGKPWGVAATGSMIIDGDDGSGRATWLGRVGAYLAERGALWVTYFESDVGVDIRLHDEKSRQAWAELVRASARGWVTAHSPAPE